MYPKNAASPQRIAVGAVVQISDGAVQTSGVSVKVMPQGGAAGAGGGTTAYEEGIVHYVPTQAETNYASFMVIAYKTGCIPVAVTIVTTASAVAGYAGLDWATINAPTTAVNLSGTNIDTDQVIASVTGNVGGNVTGSVGSVVGAVGSVTARVTANTDQLAGQTVTAAAGVTFPTSVASPTNITAGTITTVTNLTNLPSIPANWLTAAGMDATASAEIADALLGRNVAGGSSSGRLVKEALYALRNKWTVSGGTYTVYATDDSTPAWTSSVTGTAGADPLTASDPA